jgi:hypothetical protein
VKLLNPHAAGSAEILTDEESNEAEYDLLYPDPRAVPSAAVCVVREYILDLESP